MANQGINDSERYLGKLCRSSFLSLWSYQGLFRDQGGGKEICDLLVVFGPHILIFSDKYCEFPDTGDLQTDWNRWFKKSIAKSAQQIWGAERWLKEHPDRVFLDQGCTQRLPIYLPSVSDMRVHRIAVAHGAGQRCQYHLGGSGSLMINMSLVGDDHYKSLNEHGMPFAVGTVDDKQGYVHVLDDTTLDIILRTLDTTTDFIAYLEKKEALLKKYSIFAAGEEELLGIYLRDTNPDGEPDFIFPNNNVDHIGIEEGFWEEFLISSERHAMLRANEISYAWDALIEKFSFHIATNTQHFTTHPGDINANEQIVRFMAAESRTRRRMLVRKFIDLITTTPRTHKAVSVLMPSDQKSLFYVLLVLPQLAEIDYEEYREGRRMLLQAYCLVTKVRFPHALDIIGIATESGHNGNRSEDAIYIDTRDWNEEQQKNAEQAQRDLELLNAVKVTHTIEKTYPDTPRYGRDAKKRSNKIPRNAPCPCSSGKKFKHCCLRAERSRRDKS